eukprot:scaffold24312_cov114-Isochrysis_galbana.AAC.1
MHRAPLSAVVELLQKNSNARVLHDGAADDSERRHDGRRRRRHGLTCPVAARDAGPFGLHTCATRTRPHTHARKHLLPPPHQPPMITKYAQTQRHNNADTNFRNLVQRDQAPLGRTGFTSSERRRLSRQPAMSFLSQPPSSFVLPHALLLASTSFLPPPPPRREVSPSCGGIDVPCGAVGPTLPV